MRKNHHQRIKQTGDESDWIVNPLSESDKEKAAHIDFDVDDHDHDHDVEVEHSQTCSPSNSKSYDGIKFKWVSRNVEKSAKSEVGVSSAADIGPRYEVGESSSDIGQKCEEVGESSFDERSETGIRERKCGVEEKIVIGSQVGWTEEGDGGDGIVRRLDELKFGVELNLSEEQIKINDQAQQDELLAMESIYGKNVYVLEKRQGLRSVQIHIHNVLPSAYTVSAKFNSDTNADSKFSDEDEFLYSFKVQYLSPIILTCLLPRSYPSHCPPSFTVSVQWLHEYKISELCTMLDLLWNEQLGKEILYQWVEWLHSSSLPYIGFDEELVLGPCHMLSAPDRRALSGSISSDIDIPSMKSYDEDRQHENFLSGFHQCYICFSEYAGIEFLRFPCHHFFCIKCMKTYADVHVKEGTVNKLQCPNTECGSMIPPGLLKRLLSEEEFERWESLMLQNTLDSMPDVTYCPRCETTCLEDEDQHALCSKCFFSFCTLCRERRHVGIACITPELKLQILKDRQNSSQLKDEQRRKVLDMINELQSVKEILRDAKQCPSCKMAISRTDGCNKMECSQCGQYFCYRCSKAISGYEHFSEGKCELFPEDDLFPPEQQWEERINARQVMAQIQAQVFNGNARPCPNCRQLNAKVGNNNHIFCWACQNHYCYLCRKTVRRSSEHYGPKGCKQHSVD